MDNNMFKDASWMLQFIRSLLTTEEEKLGQTRRGRRPLKVEDITKMTEELKDIEYSITELVGRIQDQSSPIKEVLIHQTESIALMDIQRIAVSMTGVSLKVRVLEKLNDIMLKRPSGLSSIGEIFELLPKSPEKTQPVREPKQIPKKRQNGEMQLQKPAHEEVEPPNKISGASDFGEEKNSTEGHPLRKPESSKKRPLDDDDDDTDDDNDAANETSQQQGLSKKAKLDDGIEF